MQTDRWNNFLREISNLLFFWFFGVCFFFVYRSLFITIYSKELGANLSAWEFFKTVLFGFKFDCTAVSYFLIVPFVCTLLLSYFNKFDIIARIRIIFQYLFVILSTLICIVTINYYKEFNDQFNNFLFLGLDDDKEAVLNTIIDYYNPTFNITLFLIISVLGLLIFKLFEKKTSIYNVLKRVQPKLARFLFVLIILYLFVSCLRGTLTHPPVMRKWAAISVDPFLNKTIINPYRTLKYAYEDYKKMSEISGENPYVKDIKNIYDEDLVSQIIIKKANGDTIEKPKQIFLIIMESYDAWPLMDKYSSFGLSDRLTEISQKGIHFTNFLPAYNATFYAYGTITAGIPYNGINISRLATMSDPYITSIFNQFKKLGYKTNMFYGGFLSWENIGEFTTHMGCDKVYSAIDAGGKSESGTWGVEDEKLFDLVIQKTNTEEYSFNVILTSSYHAPYCVDLESKGFEYKSVDDFPELMKKYSDGRMTLEELGHLWYGDWAIGRFVDEAEEKYGNSLYAFTGDHFGRKFINHNPNLYECSAVPFIIYGKNIKAGKNLTPGSHIDIAPTLIEMIAPKDFVYYSFGSSLLHQNKEYGVGFEKTIDSDSLYFSAKDEQVYAISLSNFMENKRIELKYKDEYEKIMGLSWHYIIRGDSLNKKDNKNYERQ